MRILAIDTATKTAGLAILKDGRPQGEIILNVGLTHSVSLLPAMHQLLKLSNLTLDDIDALAYSCGPGSFTGLRIGGAFITSVAQARNLPVYAIPTLDTLAFNAERFTGIIAPILDARKNEVYSATYQIENKYINKLSEDKALTIEEFMDQFTNPDNVMVLGDAVVKYVDLLQERGFKIPTELLLTPRPSNLAYLAYQKHLSHEEAHTYQEIKLYYLRASEAEVKLKQKCGFSNA